MVVHMSSAAEFRGQQAIVRFLRTVSDLASELADELESVRGPVVRPMSLDQAGLGSLQRQVAEAPGMDTGSGVSPREITKALGRADEPNVRTALAAMQKRGVAELIQGVTPQRWRLTALYRPSDEAT